MNQTLKTKNPHPGDGGAGKRGRRHTSIPNAVSAAFFLFCSKKSAPWASESGCREIKYFGAPNIRKNGSKVNYLVRMRRFINALGLELGDPDLLPAAGWGLALPGFLNAIRIHLMAEATFIFHKHGLLPAKRAGRLRRGFKRFFQVVKPFFNCLKARWNGFDGFPDRELAKPLHEDRWYVHAI